MKTGAPWTSRPVAASLALLLERPALAAAQVLVRGTHLAPLGNVGERPLMAVHHHLRLLVGLQADLRLLRSPELLSSNSSGLELTT
ncbi:hypothetical protein JQX13_06180 [Archangium violaceum]|uniref:hypothetical protein n=1 Tax=Archangium violaceum TaxID=83451 RepID=UPI00193BE0F1|nr:hypothetical protein [Archangium violaceum]QRK09708.1 hypothetical protein JQX13_06180 [Archangium violaceum]